MEILVILTRDDIRKQMERAFREELPEATFSVVKRSDLNLKDLSKSSPDMLIIERGPSNTETTNLIREIRSATKVPIVLMATERDAYYVSPGVSDKYESIYETSREARLPAWIKKFNEESELKTKSKIQ